MRSLAPALRRLLLSGLLATAFSLAGATVASAQVYVGVSPPQGGPVDVGTAGEIPTEVLGVQFRRDVPTQLPSQVLGIQSQPQVRVLDTSARRAPVGGLAITGGDVLGLCVLAAVALGAGVAMVRAGRRRASHS